jgi:hypothetical protein
LNHELICAAAPKNFDREGHGANGGTNRSTLERYLGLRACS